MLPYIVITRWTSRNTSSETREMITAYQVWGPTWLSFLCLDLVRADGAIKAQLTDLKQISPPGSLPKSVQRHNYIRVVPPSGVIGNQSGFPSIWQKAAKDDLKPSQLLFFYFHNNKKIHISSAPQLLFISIKHNPLINLLNFTEKVFL